MSRLRHTRLAHARRSSGGRVRTHASPRHPSQRLSRRYPRCPRSALQRRGPHLRPRRRGRRSRLLFLPLRAAAGPTVLDVFSLSRPGLFAFPAFPGARRPLPARCPSRREAQPPHHPLSQQHPVLPLHRRGRQPLHPRASRHPRAPRLHEHHRAPDARRRRPRPGHRRPAAPRRAHLDRAHRQLPRRLRHFRPRPRVLPQGLLEHPLLQ